MKRRDLLAATAAAGITATTTAHAATEPLSDFARNYHERMFPNRKSTFPNTDPDYVRMLDNFAFDQVVQSDDLPENLRHMAILAALIGMGSIDEFKIMLPVSFNFGVTPVQAKEIIYQATAYLGIGRVYPFLVASNDIYRTLGIALPVADNSPQTDQSRFERGRELQIQAFGKSMENFIDNGPDDTRRIRLWLIENCFGDYYARGGLSLKEREMITFCFLASQGGCESQLEGHTQGNLHVGNDKTFLLNVIAQMLPFIGYPRALNAIAVVEKVCGKGSSSSASTSKGES